MAYNESTAQNIREVFLSNGIEFIEKKMFSGLCFMVDDKMCCGTHIDKASHQDFLLCRIGEEAYAEAIEKNHVIPMNFTGRAMKGYVFVTADGLRSLQDFSTWIQLCLDYNPHAQVSKKKSRSKTIK